MSGRRAKAARRAAQKVLPKLERVFEQQAAKTCPAGFWRRLLWLVRPSVRKRDQARWDANREAVKQDILRRGGKRLARIATTAMRAGLK